jgi:hypothetical protein
MLIDDVKPRQGEGAAKCQGTNDTDGDAADPDVHDDEAARDE